jgi:hypothetical protein
MNEPVSPENVLPPINPYPSLPNDRLPNGQVRYADSTQTGLPRNLRDWWSNEVFKIVTFFVLVIAILSTTSIAFFRGALSNEQYLGVCSSLLFLMSPSPLTMIKKTKKPILIQQPFNSPV